MIEKKYIVPLMMSALNIIFGFIFFAIISRQNIEFLGIFSFVHSGSIILSHFFRFGTDFDIFKNSTDLKNLYGDEDNIINYMLTINLSSLLFLLIIHNLFSIPLMIFYTILIAILLSLNVIIANFFRRKNYVLLYSVLLNSPFIIAALGSFLFTISNSFTAIYLFVGAFVILLFFEILLLKSELKIKFFKPIRFSAIKPILSNLYPTFIGGIILLFMEQLPVLVFGWSGDFESAAIFKIFSKICIVLVIISNAFFAATIPEISKTDFIQKGFIESLYNKASSKAFILSVIYIAGIFLFLPIIMDIFNVQILYINLLFLFIASLVPVFSGPINQLFIIFNQQKYLMKILLSSLLIVGPITILLIFEFGLEGAIASLLLFNLFWIVPSLFKFYSSNKINLFLPYYSYQKLTERKT
jgi:O-antigen/teichoic acid export membrane protein